MNTLPDQNLSNEDPQLGDQNKTVNDNNNETSFPVLYYDNCDDYSNLKVLMQADDSNAPISTPRITKTLKRLDFSRKITEIKRTGRMGYNDSFGSMLGQTNS